MSGTLALRVQTKTGRFVLRGLTPTSTLWTLQKLLEERTSIHPDSQKILFGYPPKELSSYDPTTTLDSLQMKSGETIIVDTTDKPRLRTVIPTADSTLGPLGPPLATVNVPTFGESREIGSTAASVDIEGVVLPNVGEVGSVKQDSGPHADLIARDDAGARGSVGGGKGAHLLGKLTRKVVPADNSCLFRSIGILLGSGGGNPEELRQLVAGIILSDPQTYNTAVLEKTNMEYIDWLLREESWGGAIELSVFSKYYKTELDVVDVQTQRVDRFGEGKGYEQRALLIYDGIHYDPLVLERKVGSVPQRVFPVDDETVLFQALEMAKDAFEARQFTNLHKFALRCLVCGQGLVGQEDALGHAKTTGHINFGEMKGDK